MKKVLGTVLFTAVEAAGLAAWLALTMVQPLVAIVVLAVALIGEHLISFRVRNANSPFPVPKILLVAAIETVTWIAWLALGPATLGAVLVLVIGLLFGHVLELNTVNNRPLFEAFLERAFMVLDITFIETIIGSLWVVLAGVSPVNAIVLLFSGLFVEHAISGEKRVGAPK